MTMTDRDTSAAIVEAGMATGPVGGGVAEAGAAAVALFAMNAPTALAGGPGALTVAWITGAANAKLSLSSLHQRGGISAAPLVRTRTYAMSGVYVGAALPPAPGVHGVRSRKPQLRKILFRRAGKLFRASGLRWIRMMDILDPGLLHLSRAAYRLPSPC